MTGALFGRLDLDPDRGIADRVQVLRDALLVPPVRKRNWVVEAGLFDAAGAPVPLAQGWHFPARPATEFPPLPTGDFPHLGGRYFFAGHYMRQFGQFLLETTARLWHLHHAPQDYDGLILLAQPGADHDRIARDLAGFMALCGWRMPPFVWPEGPVRLEQVTVPMQGCGALDLMMAAPEYRAMIHARFARDVRPAGPERLYISRTAFADPHGSLVEEKRLEALLAAEGFVPFHPQDHTLEAQIAHYRAAKVIAGVDGSAFHLVSLVVRPDQRLVLFQRRPAPEVLLQAAQLRRFGARDVTVVPAQPTGWSPAGVRRSALSVFGVTDFVQAGRQLAEHGLIRDPGAWTATGRDALRAALRSIGAWLDADMYEVTSPSQSLAAFARRSDPGRIRLFGERRWQKRALPDG